MNSCLVLTAACVSLVASGMASAKQPQEQQPYTHQTMQDHSDASAQDGTYMDYGGVPDTQGQSGSARRQTCSPMPQCQAIIGGPM